jgi:hypothetical protein
MANDLKASVSITADTSGLISGVNGAMEKINRISASSTAMAGMMGAQKVLQLAQQMYTAISDRSEHLSKLAHTFSPEAMTSAANLSQAQLRSDMAVGQAMGPVQAGIDRAKEDAIAEETASTLQNAKQIGEGMIVLNAIWNQTRRRHTHGARFIESDAGDGGCRCCQPSRNCCRQHFRRERWAATASHWQHT